MGLQFVGKVFVNPGPFLGKGGKAFGEAVLQGQKGCAQGLGKVEGPGAPDDADQDGPIGGIRPIATGAVFRADLT